MNRLNLSPNVRLLSCSIVPDGNSQSEGNIKWTFQTNGSPEIIKSISSSGKDVIINLVNVTKIHAFTVWPNEHLASMGIFLGEDTKKSLVQIPISAFQKLGNQGGYVRGDGVNFNVGSDILNWLVTKTVNNFQYTPPNSYFLGDATVGQASGNYVGSTPNRALEKLISGLSRAFGHRLINNTTMTAVASNTTADVIDFIVNTPNHFQLNLNQNDSQGWPGANVFTTNASIEIMAVVEL